MSEHNLNICVAPPDKFNFECPAAWPQWKKRMERYMSVSGMNTRSEEEKINTVLYIMGEESEQILLQFATIPNTLEATLKAFDTHFIPKRNVIFERFKFNSRVQRAGESVDSFITDLHSLAEHCEFQTLKDELIRDRLVVGMLDVKTSETMQLRADLKLKDAITMARQAELQSQQSQVLRQEHQRHSVNAVHKGAFPKRDPGNRSIENQKSKSQTDKSEDRKCEFCGYSFHNRDKCPAKNEKCKNCGKIGHFKIKCRSNKKVMAVDVDKDLFLGSISLANVNSLARIGEWKAKVFVEAVDLQIIFHIDSGADITALPSSYLTPLVMSKLQQTSESITGPDGSKLKVLGTISTGLSQGSKTCKTNVYFIENLKFPLLGKNEICKMGILKMADPPEPIVNSLVVQTTVNAESEFPGIFNEIGVFQGEMKLNIIDDATPFAQTVPRTVPIPLLEQLKGELNRLTKLEIIESVDEPTDWVAPIVIVRKNDKEIRICGDYTRLNRNVLRSHFPIPKVESTLSKLVNCSYFSKLDASSGFYQIKLEQESQSLTTFITPFGRYKFKRLPFGISCAPEYFCSKFSKILGDLPGVVVHVDDILIFASTMQEHDRILREVLKRIHNEGLTLNKRKCSFGVTQVSYLGHLISGKGISVDQERIAAIVAFPEPTNKKDLMQLLGMINFITRFIPNKAEVLAPLNELLKKDTEFIWGISQKQAFDKVKKLLIEAPCLKFYDPNKQLIVSADASSYGLGAALFEIGEEGREIVAYKSRTLNETEKRYAQIEREALALTWACEKFEEFILGISVTLETDHKPLIQILQTKNLDQLSPRLQRCRMRLLRYNYKVLYTPGKNLIVPDVLSRCPVNTDKEAEEFSAEMEAQVNAIIRNLPVKDKLLVTIQEEQAKDPICKKLRQFSSSNWPAKTDLPIELIPYYQYRYEISFCEGFLLINSRLIIPSSLQSEILKLIHAGHQGIVKCRARAKQTVWWLGLSKQIDQVVTNCKNCIEERVNHREPLICGETPSRPWQKIGIDFEKSKIWYMIVTDYYSRFLEIFPLKSMTTPVVLAKLITLIGRYGIPETCRSDRGPQFLTEFRNFAEEIGFEHVTSSPYYPQSNGAVEAAVKIAKQLIRKNGDGNKSLQLALLEYRSTPLDCGFSPAELMFSRKIKNAVPILPSKLNQVVDTKAMKEKDKIKKQKQAQYYNQRHRAKELSKLNVGDKVWITNLRKYGVIISVLSEPRSYLIKTTDNSVYRRNRWHLIPAPCNLDVIPEINHDPVMKSENMSQTNVLSENHNSAEGLNHQQETNVHSEIQAEVSPCKLVVDNKVKPEIESRKRKPPVWMRDYVS